MTTTDVPGLSPALLHATMEIRLFAHAIGFRRQNPDVPVALQELHQRYLREGLHGAAKAVESVRAIVHLDEISWPVTPKQRVVTPERLALASMWVHLNSGSQHRDLCERLSGLLRDVGA